MSKQQPQVVRLKFDKLVFEVLLKPGCALKAKEGRLSVANAVMSEEIYVHPYQKGVLAKPADLARAFTATTFEERVKEMLEKGEVQLSAAERKEATEEKRRRIVAEMQKIYVDPATNKPHPALRMENVLNELHITVDPAVPMSVELKDIDARIGSVLPVQRKEMEVHATVPASAGKQCDAVFRKFGKVTGVDSAGDKKVYHLSIVPGDFEALSRDLSKATRQNYQLDVAGAEPEAKKPQKRRK